LKIEKSRDILKEKKELIASLRITWITLMGQVALFLESIRQRKNKKEFLIFI